MTLCANPGCPRNDDVSDNKMYLEHMDADGGVWVVVCAEHVDHDQPAVRVTDEVRDISMETLTQIKDDLLD